MFAPVGPRACPMTSWACRPARTGGCCRLSTVGRAAQFSQLFAGASPAVVDAIRWPHPEVLQVLDPRPLLDGAAILAARFGGGLLIAETLAAALAHGRQLWFGTPANIGPHLQRAASELRLSVHVAT